MNPFTEKFLRQLDALRNHKEYSEIEPIVTDLLAMNSLEIIRSMTEDLSENFRKIENTYLSLEKNIRVIRFYWAGKEVFPYIPTTSWIADTSCWQMILSVIKVILQESTDSRVNIRTKIIEKKSDCTHSKKFFRTFWKMKRRMRKMFPNLKFTKIWKYFSF
ncbi:hypothetical protein LEP1GSC092_4744 [Leptospira interrogans serovar Pyrogenes str. R168]|nr:hypothetical protein LEP1GSC092_4744 [Leptospira interrogans serovar Pyrogenes str. R168]